MWQNSLPRLNCLDLYLYVDTLTTDTLFVKYIVNYKKSEKHYQ